jgi:hypothetical protein
MRTRLASLKHTRLGGGSSRTGVSREAVAVRQRATAPYNGASIVRLEDVRGALLRQEDSIIFALIERAQFARNEAVYVSGAVPVPAYDKDGRCFTFLEYFLRDTEASHGRIRRYTSPDEHAFFPEALPPMVCPLLCCMHQVFNAPTYFIHSEAHPALRCNQVLLSWGTMAMGPAREAYGRSVINSACSYAGAQTSEQP